MKAIIGLGNLGSKYDATRHNAGFEVMDHLNIYLNTSLEFKNNDRLYSHIVLAQISKQQCLLVKPKTFMNDSGKAFIAIKNWYKLQLSDFLVVHDDVSIPLGKIRLQKEGGAGGQHGVESIISVLGGDKSFNRLKVGVGPDPGGDKRADYVLQKFRPEEKLIIKEIIALASQACLLWLDKGVEKAMNEFNGIDIFANQKTEIEKDK